MSEFQYRIGDKVSIQHEKYPGVWLIKSVGPVNCVVKPEAGGRELRAPRSMLIAPSADAPQLPPKQMFELGQVVRMTGRFAGVYVVIKDDGGDKVNVAKLGGDGSRYVRSVRAGLEPVELENLVEVLA